MDEQKVGMKRWRIVRKREDTYQWIEGGNGEKRNKEGKRTLIHWKVES